MLKLIQFLFISSAIGCTTTSNTTHVSSNETHVVSVDTVRHDNPKENIVESNANDKKEMKIGLMLPFFTNEIEYDSLGITITDVSENSLLAVQYYRGVQLALDSLDRAGVKIQLSVFDSRKDTERVKNILQWSDAKNADVIVGPVSNGELQLAGKICSERKQVLISPLSASYNLAAQNPYFILANAGLKTQCEKMADYINTRYAGERVLMVYRRENEVQLAAYFKATLKTKPLELTSKSDSSFYHIDNFLSVINPNIIIIPSFDEEFVNLMTKQLHELAPTYNFQVFGMPTWSEMQTLRLDYLQTIHTHITASFFANDSLPEFKKFREEFKNKFNSRPDEYAYQGYSMLLFLASLWKENDNRWFSHITDESLELGVDYSIQPVTYKSSSTDFLENKNVYVLMYRSNKLIRVK